MTTTMADAAPGSASGPVVGHSDGEPAPLAPPLLWGDTHPWFLDDPQRPCYTCGAAPSHRFHDGSPAYKCGPHPVIRKAADWQPGADPIRLGITLGARAVESAMREGLRRVEYAKAHPGALDREGASAAFSRLDAARVTRNQHGAAAELAVSKLTGLPWTGRGGSPRKGDVGPYEVRWSANPYLPLHPKDRNRTPYILVMGDMPTFRIIGWLPRAGLGKQPEWWREDIPYPAWMVPHTALHDPRTIPELAQGA